MELRAAIAELSSGWQGLLADPRLEKIIDHLETFLTKEYAQHTIYPREDDVLNALRLCPLEQVRVVILGQDPYINPNQANGLAFSVNQGSPLPPSLRNIFLELSEEYGTQPRRNGDLSDWAQEGVLLLNSALTVRGGISTSHVGQGWESVTDALIRGVSEQQEGVVFLLWGRHAQERGRMISRGKHLILHAAHPSPLSARRGFFGCNHFRKTNDFLLGRGEKPISWGIDPPPPHQP